MTTAHPLTWPDGWPRTPLEQRIDGYYHFLRPAKRGDYQKRRWTFSEARLALFDEVRKLGGGEPILSTNFRLGATGVPRDDQRRPLDQGVAIYFELGLRHVAMARDAYQRAEENMRSLALAIEALRQLERHGGGHMMERAFAGFTALSAPDKPKRAWHEVLGCDELASLVDIEIAYRAAAKRAHPDAGGSAAAMAEINAARDAARKARGV